MVVKTYSGNSTRTLLPVKADTIGVAGDNNSSMISFKIPSMYDTYAKQIEWDCYLTDEDGNKFKPVYPLGVHDTFEIPGELTNNNGGKEVKYNLILISPDGKMEKSAQASVYFDRSAMATETPEGYKDFWSILTTQAYIDSTFGKDVTEHKPYITFTTPRGTTEQLYMDVPYLDAITGKIDAHFFDPGLIVALFPIQNPEDRLTLDAQVPDWAYVYTGEHEGELYLLYGEDASLPENWVLVRTNTPTFTTLDVSEDAKVSGHLTTNVGGDKIVITDVNSTLVASDITLAELGNLNDSTENIQGAIDEFRADIQEQGSHIETIEGDITGINAELDTKVDKIPGKGLSTEDYTSAEKTKLAGIESGAQVNTVLSVAGRTGEVILTKGDVGLGNVDNTSDLSKPISIDTQTALDGKLDKNTPIIAGTHTKITYDANGLVIAGSNITPSDIPDISATYVPLAGTTAIAGDMIPATDKTVDIGSASKSYNDAYMNNVSVGNDVNVARDVSIGGEIIVKDVQLDLDTQRLFSDGDTISTRDGVDTSLTADEYTGIIAHKYNGTDDGALIYDRDGYARVGDITYEVITLPDGEPINGRFILHSGQYTEVVPSARYNYAGGVYSQDTDGSFLKIRNEMVDLTGQTFYRIDASSAQRIATRDNDMTDNSFVAWDGTNFTLYTRDIASADLPDLSAQYVATNPSITGGTFTKLTVDTKGLVTDGSQLTASDIPDISSTYQTKSNLVTNFSSPTDTKYPSAKLVSDQLATKQPTVTAGTGLVFAGATLNHSNSISAGSVGSATEIPVLSVDAQGHVTAKSGVTVYPPTSAGTSGQFWKSKGTGQGEWSDIPPTVALNLNGSDTLDATWYSAVTSGTVGQLMASAGSGNAPIWVDAPEGLVVIDNLTTPSSTSALSANQGVVLNGAKVNYTDILNAINKAATNKTYSTSFIEGRFATRAFTENLYFNRLSATTASLTTAKPTVASTNYMDTTTADTTFPTTAEISLQRTAESSIELSNKNAININLNIALDKDEAGLEFACQVFGKETSSSTEVMLSSVQAFGARAYIGNSSYTTVSDVPAMSILLDEIESGATFDIVAGGSIRVAISRRQTSGHTLTIRYLCGVNVDGVDRFSIAKYNVDNAVIGSNQIADGAITTSKIGDLQVTEGKLSQAVQDTLDSSVLFTSQSLSTAQKGVARGNIGAVEGNTAISGNASALNFPSYDTKGLVTGSLDTAYARNISINGSNYGVFAQANSDATGFYAPTTAGTSGKYLKSTGGTPVWDDVPAGVTPTLNGTVTLTPSWYAPITAGTSGQVLLSTGGAPSWGSIDFSAYQLKSNLVSAFQSTTDDTHYPSEKLVKDNLDSLVSSISSEASARASADTTLQNNINAEASARSSADTILQNNINTKVTANTAITGATATKVTYDSKGLVTGGTTLSSGDIPDISATYIPVAGSSVITGSLSPNLTNAVTLGTTSKRWKEADIVDANVSGVLKVGATPSAGTSGQYLVSKGTSTPPEWQSLDLSPYQLKSNLVTAFQSTTDNTHYPSEKLVKDNIDTINTTLGTKVDKVSGKGLSTNDYTNAEKTKLAGIEAGAQVNSVTSVAGRTGAVALTKSDVGLANVDNTSDADKPISTATQDALDTKVDKVSGKGLSTNDYTTAEKNKLAGIAAGAQVNTVTSVAGRTGAIALTKADVGLSNVDNTSDLSKPISTATQDALDTKVDKVSGKGLSTEDFTSAEKTKLAGVEAGAQVNTVTSVAGRTGAVVLTKADVGLGNVDNTSDASKPISTATQTALNAKQNLNLNFSNVSASSWVADSTYADYAYRCTLATSGVTANDYPIVTFAMAQAISGDYAPVAETVSNGVYIYSKVNTSITIPSVVVTKG